MEIALSRIPRSVGSAFVGVVVGCTATMLLSSWLNSYGKSAQLIAEATVHVSALERLAEDDTAGAVNVLQTSLDSTMLGLEANQNSMTPAQKAQVAKIKKRSAQLR
jgi:hypothetical protein